MPESKKPRRRNLQRAARELARAEGINYTTALRRLQAEEEAAKEPEVDG